VLAGRLYGEHLFLYESLFALAGFAVLWIEAKGSKT
jgi:hypothetical protein